MGLILAQAGAGRFLTQEEIHAEVKHGKDCTFGAIRVSVRYLEKHGMVLREKDPIRKLVLVKPTVRAYDLFRPRL